MSRQFTPTPLVCPCCGHILGEQAYFQSFEANVAKWIDGKMAPNSTPGYDVCDSPHFPGMTFQVKYAKAFRYLHKGKTTPSVSWVWSIKRLDERHPDFFILFGIDEQDIEHCFLISRADFLKMAWQRRTGQSAIRATAKPTSDRFYNYTPKIWRYVVRNPERSLIDAIREYRNQPEDSMFMEQHRRHADEMREMSKQGMSQVAIGKHFGISCTTVSRILRNVRR